MKLFRPLAGLCVFALAALPAVAQRGGGSSGHAGGGFGGGSHASSGGGGRSYGGGSGHASGGYSSGSYGSSARAGASGVSHGSAGSYSYSGTGTRETGAGRSVSNFTNSGGIRFSDFGFEESPRFTASMLSPNRSAAASRPTSDSAAPNQRSEHERQDRTDHGFFDHGSRSYRFAHSGLWFFGAFWPAACDPIGPVDFNEPFLYDDAFGCYGAGFNGPENEPDASAAEDDVSEDAYPADDEAVAASPDDTVEADQDKAAASQPTLLQLKDGSMYGLTDYWVEGGELHYVTTYGGANAIPLDRIDLAKTVELNAAHGQAFVLEYKSAAPKVPSNSTH